jgi:vacuolar-type H+-ATPase subunit C/Vma6
MNTLKKLFLLSVLGLGVCVKSSLADHKTDTLIFNAVVKVLHNKTITLITLPEILKELKTKVLEVVHPHADQQEYKEFYLALKDLDVENLAKSYIAILAAQPKIEKVVATAPEKTKNYIQAILKKHGLKK